MAAVNEAYEVLNNPGMFTSLTSVIFFSHVEPNLNLPMYFFFLELRQRFDNGEDPNDPMAAQGGHPFFANGQHPFAQFFQQSGGQGGYQFHFSTGH